MEVKEILRNLREKNNLTQDQMAERINVTGRQPLGNRPDTA